MIKEKENKFSVSDSVSFWHKGKHMNGTVIEPREYKILVCAWPIDTPTDKHDYLIEKWRLKPVKEKQFLSHSDIEELSTCKIPLLDEHRKYSVSFSIYIGEELRKYKLSLVTTTNRLGETERQFTQHEIALPYVNSIGTKTVWVTTFGRIKELAMDWKQTMTRKNTRLPYDMPKIISVEEIV